MANYFRIACPHCAGDVVINMNVSEVKSDNPMGPTHSDLGPEVDAYVLEAIRHKKVSFQTLAELLEERGTLTPQGKTKWYATSARRLYLGAVARKEYNEQKTETTNSGE